MKAIAEELRRLTAELHCEGSVVAGSEGEKERAEKVRAIAEERLGSSRLIKIPVLSWELRGLEVSPRPRSAAVAPYVESSFVDAPWATIEEPSLEGKVAVAKEPPDPDDIKHLALVAAHKGAVGLIVESPSAPRIIVTNGHWGFSYSIGSPTPIPVVIVEEGYSARLGGRVSIALEARVRESYGYTVEAGALGKAEKLVIVGAHHDKWFSGFADNTVGLSQALVTAELLMERGVETRFVSFSAEEHGALGYASWYWAWGSRLYAKGISAVGAEGGVIYVNFDMASIGDLTFSGSPQLSPGGRERCCECPECDSFSFASNGIQTLGFHSFWSEEVKRIYHTPLDLPSASSIEVAAEAVSRALSSVLRGPRWEAFEGFLRSLLGRGPLEARAALHYVESLSKRVGWEAVYPELAKSFLKPVHYGSLLWESSRLEALWFPEVTTYLRLREDVEMGRAPREVWVLGEERLLYALGKGGDVSLRYQLRANMERLGEELERVGRELLK